MPEKFSFPIAAELLLPHARPMLCIDHLVRATDDAAEAEVLLRDGYILLNSQGNIEPCGFVELAAQCAGAGFGWSRRRRGETPLLGFLAAVQDFTVTEPAQKGDLLRIRTVRSAEVGGVSLVEASIHAGERWLASGKLKVFVFAEGMI